MAGSGALADAFAKEEAKARMEVEAEFEAEVEAEAELEITAAAAEADWSCLAAISAIISSIGGPALVISLLRAWTPFGPTAALFRTLIPF